MEITLRTRIGFGYNATGETITEPVHFGTIRTIFTHIQEDGILKSLIAGGAYVKHQYFLYDSKKRNWVPVEPGVINDAIAKDLGI